MSRITSTGVSAVRPRVTSELSSDGNSMAEDRGRSRDLSRRTDASRGPEIPSIQQLRSRFQPNEGPRTSPPTAGRGVTAAAVSRVPEVRISDQQSRKRPSPEVDPIDMDDPEKYFESTNHTQRFQQTFALFAKMEEQTRLDQERRRQILSHRSKSPTRFPVSSPSSLAISPSVGPAGDVGTALLSPTLSTDSESRSPANRVSRFGGRPRVMSSTAEVRPDVAKAAVPVPPGRCGSVDRLDDDAPYEPSSLKESAKFSSRSETDLGGSGRDDVPSPKWLMRHYEDVVKRNAALFGGQVSRRRTRPVENHVDSEPVRRDEAARPQFGSRPPPFFRGQLDAAENIPPYGPNSSSRIGARKDPTASVGGSLRYGRPTEPPAPKSAQPATEARPVGSRVEDGGAASRPAGGRSSSKADDGDSVINSLEAWKTRRRSNGKFDETEREQGPLSSFEARQGSVADDLPEPKVDVETASPKENAATRVMSEKGMASDAPKVFGVSLRPTAQKSEHPKPKLHTSELETAEVRGIEESVKPGAAQPASAEVNLRGGSAKTDVAQSSSTLPPTTEELIATADEAGRRLSLEGSDVRHFPKDDVMMTGGHHSVSPRSSSTEDGQHHRLPSLSDQKPEDQAEDLVFVKEETFVEQARNADVELTDVDRDFLPAADNRMSSESSELVSFASVVRLQLESCIVIQSI